MKDITLKALTAKEATDMLYAEFGIFPDELFVEDFEKGPGYYEVAVGSRGEIEDVCKITEEETYKAVESAAEYVSTTVFGDYDSCEDDDYIDEEFFCLEDTRDDHVIISIEEELGIIVVRIGDG